MTALALPASAPALALARQTAEMSALKAKHKDLLNEKNAMAEDLAILSRSVRSRVGSGLSSALTLGAALGAGVMDGYLGATNSEKIGPVKLTSAIGVAAAIGSLFMPDADIAEGLSAVGRGLASGPAYLWGREKGEAMAAKKGASAPKV